LEPKDKIGDIILVVPSNPAVLINLKHDQKCTIVGMKMSHSGVEQDQYYGKNILKL
jgi:F-box protein 11